MGYAIPKKEVELPAVQLRSGLAASRFWIPITRCRGNVHETPDGSALPHERRGGRGDRRLPADDSPLGQSGDPPARAREAIETLRPPLDDDPFPCPRGGYIGLDDWRTREWYRLSTPPGS